jgi:hypothetical protein
VVQKKEEWTFKTAISSLLVIIEKFMTHNSDKRGTIARKWKKAGFK